MKIWEKHWRSLMILAILHSAMLVRMLNSYHGSAWPAGAVERLGEIQRQIRSGAGSADGPVPAELARQRRSAEKLFARARALMDRGDLLAAQKPLLEILNAHHPRTWPAGALPAFQQIQKAFAKSPASAPSFFDIKARD